MRIAYRGSRRVAVVSLAAAALALVLAARPGAAADVTCLLVSPEFDRSQAVSTACVSCHDGTCAAAVTSERSHPVERSYASAWMRRRFDLRSIPDAALVLSNGCVTCASCHDGRSGLPHRTAQPVVRLCQGCHDR
jgi:Cytochrome c7 and related cytochrome c